MNNLETKQKKKAKKKEVKITKQLIKTRLVNHFKNHIGEQNKTTKEEIFQISIGINSLEFSGFQRFYIWETINKEIKKLRKDNLCFIIKKKGFYFVLKEQDEAEYFKGICDRAINGMEKAKIKADVWVEKESWRNLEHYEGKETQEETPVSNEYNEEYVIKEIDDLNEKAKTKIIKLFDKDENNNKRE